VAWGVNEIAASLEPLTSRLARDVRALGCTVPDERVSHMLGVQLPGGVPAVLADRLAASRVYVSVRGNSIRVAPYLYNDARDIDRFVSLLREALAAGD
jgi:selenocysteine lyase/cysteine desulfurase